MPAPAPSLPVLHRVALRIAAVSGGAAGASAAVVLALATGAVWPTVGGALVVAAVVFGVTYQTTQQRVAARLELARRTLRAARKRRFDGLARLAGTTERDELDALIRQVYRAGRTLQREIERLETVESYRRDFLGDVSHELRTPIFAVSGFAETLLDGALDDPNVRRRFVEKILANARRLETLSRDLAEIARLESGRLQITPAAVGVAALVAEVVDSLERPAAAAGVTLSVRVPGGLPDVAADRDRLRQVLSNLIENAVKYNDSGGTVKVTAKRLSSGNVRLAVVDDGIGIPADAVPRLTERFFRVDKSRSRDAGGTGLGLAIVKHILEAHGQRLAIESRPGHGSSFAFSLPAAESAPAEPPADGGPRADEAPRVVAPARPAARRRRSAPGGDA